MDTLFSKLKFFETLIYNPEMDANCISCSKPRVRYTYIITESQGRSNLKHKLNSMFKQLTTPWDFNQTTIFELHLAILSKQMILRVIKVLNWTHVHGITIKGTERELKLIRTNSSHLRSCWIFYFWNSLIIHKENTRKLRRNPSGNWVILILIGEKNLAPK